MKKNASLKVQPTEGPVVRKKYFIVPHEEVPGSNLWKGKKLKLFQGIF